MYQSTHMINTTLRSFTDLMLREFNDVWNINFSRTVDFFCCTLSRLQFYTFLLGEKRDTFIQWYMIYYNYNYYYKNTKLLEYNKYAHIFGDVWSTTTVIIVIRIPRCLNTTKYHLQTRLTLRHFSFLFWWYCCFCFWFLSMPWWQPKDQRPTCRKGTPS